MSEPTRGNKGTDQAPDQAKGVTGANGAASANGQQNGRPDFVEGRGQELTAARKAAAEGAGGRREQGGQEAGPQARPAGRWVRSAAAASGRTLAISLRLCGPRRPTM